MIKYAKSGDLMVPVLMDPEDIIRLDGRSLSIGSHGYAQLWWTDDRWGGVTLLHRWILGLRTGNPLIGDHVNRNILDNRRSNLRAVTPSESNMNRDAPVSRWGRGIRPQKSGRYVVMVKRNRVEYRLGTWDSVEEAAQAREEFLAGPLERGRAREIAKSAPHTHPNGTWVKCRTCNPARSAVRPATAS